MALYHFVTELHVTAPQEQAWELATDPTSWPTWWRWLKRVDVLEEGQENGLGARYRYTFGTALPYSLSFVSEVSRSLPPTVLEAHATGDLSGVGRWKLSPGQVGTKIRYTWIVETTKPWMNALAPIARPAFSWNHGVLMRDFSHGFVGALGAELVSMESRTVKPRSAAFGRLLDHEPRP